MQSKLNFAVNLCKFRLYMHDRCTIQKRRGDYKQKIKYIVKHFKILLVQEIKLQRLNFELTKKNDSVNKMSLLIFLTPWDPSIDTMIRIVILYLWDLPP